MTAFNPEQILATLNRHEVRYVVIGGLAAAFHGSNVPTFDVDITPEMSSANLTGLSAALKELDARVRVEGIPDGLPFAHDARSLATVTTLNLVTPYGPLDIAAQPAGLSSFSDWDAGATDIDLDGVHIRLASLADVITSKQAAGRDKDKAALPMLRSLLERLRHSS
jgi:hypothetical protein